MLLFVAMPLPINVHDACCLKVINNLRPVLFFTNNEAGL